MRVRWPGAVISQGRWVADNKDEVARQNSLDYRSLSGVVKLEELGASCEKKSGNTVVLFFKSPIKDGDMKMENDESKHKSVLERFDVSLYEAVDVRVGNQHVHFRPESV